MKKAQDQLKVVAKNLTSISKQVDKLSKQVEKLKAAAKAAPKKTAAKKAAPKKTAAKKAGAKKAPAKKTAKAGRAASGSTVLDAVFNTVKKSKQGIAIPQLKAKTKLDARQLSNALYKLSKKGMIKTVSRGVYTKA